tara:strand:+ start:940 stop:1635 length:696 start_codon:yes stop_codon:yes gene_type:complete
MLLTNKFIFLHMFRTGGTSINGSFIGTTLGYHRPRSLIPKEYEHLPVVGNVRNPFDWYVDIYYHALNVNYPMKTRTFLNFILDFKRYSFKESIKRLLDTSWMTPQDKEKSLAHAPSIYKWDIAWTDNLRKKELQSYLDSNLGFLSWLFNYMYEYKDNTKGVTYCRLEHLENDWSSFLNKKVFIPKLNPIFGSIKEPRQKNYMSYYDDELIELIENKDKNYIKQFNYNKDEY